MLTLFLLFLLIRNNKCQTMLFFSDVFTVDERVRVVLTSIVAI